MPEHIHMEITKVKDNHVETTRFVVLRRYEAQEAEVARQMGYSVDGHYCSDPRCLGESRGPRLLGRG